MRLIPTFLMRTVLAVLGLILLAGLANAEDALLNQFYRSAPTKSDVLQVINQGLINADFESCRKTVLDTELIVPKRHFEAIKKIFLHNDENLPRGLASSTEIYLRCTLSESELKAVTVHELGHIVDLSLLTASDDYVVSNFYNGTEKQYISDPSINFYKFSWLTAEKSLTNNLSDFVSGYAADGAFEDFAESYAFYILHGSDFRLLAEESMTLTQKYSFLKYFVFGGKEYGFNRQKLNLTSENLSANMGSRYDVTRLGYAL